MMRTVSKTSLHSRQLIMGSTRHLRRLRVVGFHALRSCGHGEIQLCYSSGYSARLSRASLCGSRVRSAHSHLAKRPGFLLRRCIFRKWPALRLFFLAGFDERVYAYGYLRAGTGVAQHPVLSHRSDFLLRRMEAVSRESMRMCTSNRLY